MSDHRLYAEVLKSKDISDSEGQMFKTCGHKNVSIHTPAI